jgi:hypothetical protein
MEEQKINTGKHWIKKPKGLEEGTWHTGKPVYDKDGFFHVINASGDRLISDRIFGLALFSRTTGRKPCENNLYEYRISVAQWLSSNPETLLKEYKDSLGLYLLPGGSDLTETLKVYFLWRSQPGILEKIIFAGSEEEAIAAVYE